MRYVLDNNGYVELCSKTHIECNDRGCTEYKGTIPAGYSSLEDWAINANIRAYKVVDGNLVYDPDRDSDLQKRYEREAEDNTLATHRWVKDKLSVSNSVVTDEFSSEKAGNSLIVIDDAGNYEIPYLKVENVSASYVNVISSNKNILGVEALSNTVNGVRFDINDGTITLNGTATDNIEFNLNGTSTNTEMLFLMKKDIDYAISGLTNNVSLSLYSFDGANRTSVYTGFNDVVKLSNSYLITQATLNIAKGTTFNGVVISPQLEINNRPTSYVKHEETKAGGTLVNNECVIEDLMSYEGNTIIMVDEEVTSSIKYYTHQFLNEKFAEIEVREGEINSTVSEMNKTIEGQNQKISQVTQSVDEINSKITDIADITTSAESDYASVNLVNVNESEPMTIKIHPINEDVSYLYPNNKLYPSDDLYLKCRTIRFTNTKTNEVFDYELPADLLYYDANTYDEFHLNYDSKTCSVTKRVEYIDADGNKGIKTEEIINYDFPTIPLTAGDYTVSVLSYSGVYLFVQLMAANLYTTQFATKVELSSSIEQTKDSITSEVKAEYASKDELNTSVSTIKQTTDSINLEVAKKVDNKDYTSAQILMKINGDTSSTVIKSDKLDVNAIATFTNNKLATAGSTTINGANITTGTISCDRLSGGTISGQTISGGTISGSNITATSGSIGGFGIDGSNGLTSSYATIRPNGNAFFYPNNVSRYSLSTAMTCNAQSGVLIASGSNMNTSTNGLNLDLKACSGSVAYLACMLKPDGTIERSAVSCADGVLNLRSAGTIYANGAAIGGSSSKNTKTNIVKLSQEKKDELYGLIKDVPLYEYDYKPEYGKEVNYGFLIEDVEDTKLNDLLHIVEVNEDIKTYCSEDLTRLNLIMIKELMKKVETLENKIKELESDK
jgi:hypothetical protein